MPQTNFDRITASPEVLAAFLASLPCLEMCISDSFGRTGGNGGGHCPAA